MAVGANEAKRRVLATKALELVGDTNKQGLSILTLIQDAQERAERIAAEVEHLKSAFTEPANAPPANEVLPEEAAYVGASANAVESDDGLGDADDHLRPDPEPDEGSAKSRPRLESDTHAGDGSKAE